VSPSCGPDGEKYANKKAEYYWGLRMRFQAGDVAGLTDEKAISQLAGILYEHDARGRIAIESKEETRKRGVKSPDRAEAVMLAFAAPALGWTNLDVEGDDAHDTARGVMREQLSELLPPGLDDEVLHCGECASFQASSERTGYCGLRSFRVAASERV
jgi:hypothetical protein